MNKQILIAISLISALLIFTVILFNISFGYDDKYSWRCDSIECGNILMMDTHITCGNYKIWEHKCDMTGCNKKIKCDSFVGEGIE